MLGVYVSGCSVVLKFRKTYCWNNHSKISDYHDRLLSLTESQNQITTHQAEIVINENLYSPHNNDSSSDKINTKYTPCLQKTVHFCFCQLRQISINFNKLRSVDGKVAEIVCYIDIFHLTWSMSLHYLVEGGCSKLLPNTGFVTIRLYIFGVKVKRAYCRDNFLAQRPLPDRHALVVRRCFFFVSTGRRSPGASSTRIPSLSCSDCRDARNASSSRHLCPWTWCTFRARILTILSRSVKPYSVYCVLMQ